MEKCATQMQTMYHFNMESAVCAGVELVQGVQIACTVCFVLGSFLRVFVYICVYSMNWAPPAFVEHSARVRRGSSHRGRF